MQYYCCGTVVPQEVDRFVRFGCSDTPRWVLWCNRILGGQQRTEDNLRVAPEESQDGPAGL